MNPIWIRALILVCVFAAVVIAVETLARWMASSPGGATGTRGFSAEAA